MNTYRSLELILQDILEVVNPSRDDWAVRFSIIDELRAVVQTIESLRGATVEPFGSFVSNLFTKWGDLDISIEIPNGSHISVAGRKHKQSLLGDVLRALRKRGAWRRLQFISHARIPILMFESIHKNISCDISINNLNGQMKSKLLFWISKIDDRVRQMVLLVKEWAKANAINDSKSGTLNSYSLSLLIIFHFQTCEPAILPPLKEIYPGNMVNDLIGVRSAAEKHIEETCEANIKRFKLDNSRRINQSSLSDLFISFFAKFSDINLKASEHGLSPYNAQWEDIEQNKIWLPKTYALFIEDPFEQPVNTARSVSNRQLTRISEVFQRTQQMLVLSNQTQGSIVASLVRQEAFNIMDHKLGGNPGINVGPYLGIHAHFNGNPNNRDFDFVRGQGNPSTNGGTRWRPQPNRNTHSNGGGHFRPEPQAPNARSPQAPNARPPQQLVQAIRVDKPPNPVVSHRPPQAPNARPPQQLVQAIRVDKPPNPVVSHRPPQAPNARPPQQLVQAIRVDKPPNPVVSHRPPQASHAPQAQKIWRPKSEK